MVYFLGCERDDRNPDFVGCFVGHIVHTVDIYDLYHYEVFWKNKGSDSEFNGVLILSLSVSASSPLLTTNVSYHLNVVGCVVKFTFSSFTVFLLSCFF